MSSAVVKKEKTRKNIINAAIKVLSNKEYHECLIDMIAKTADIGKGTIYLYFKSKQELYYSILFELVTTAKEIAKTAMKSSNHPSEQVRILLEKMNQFTDSHSNAFIIAKAEAGNLKGKIQLMYTEMYGGLLKQIGKIFENGVNRKMFKKYPPVLMGALVMTSMLTISKYKQINRPGARTVTTDMIADIFMNGINLK
ncbi:MAG: TetR/AcrR family transcriptional regulator [Endomicrobiales bacterium]|nr:TetR/AcrR family transcriptional regulator [Endomicrobiales bacterium]